MFYFTFLLCWILLAIHATPCSGATSAGPKRSSQPPAVNNKRGFQANDKDADVKSQQSGVDYSAEGWRFLTDTLSLGEFPQLFLKSVPTLNQALLTSIFSLSNVLPTEEEIFELLLHRENFTADGSGASLLLTAFAHHILLQFSSEDNTSLVFAASQIYGSDSTSEMALRTGREGKLKMHNGLPPSISEAAVDMMYPPDGQRVLRYFHLSGSYDSKSIKWALGHPLLAATPLGFAVSVLWLREHNRLCDKLVARYPNWSDQRLFDAARAIVTGKMMLITLREILPRLAGMEDLTFENAFSEGSEEQTQSSPLMCDLAAGLLWTWQLPDSLKYGDTEYPLSDILFTDHQPALKQGLAAIFDSLSREPAGKAMPHNHVHALKGWTKKLIRQLRRAKAPSFNSYRQMAGLPGITSFEQLTNHDTAHKLKMVYGQEDALDLYSGLVIEKTEGRAVLPPTLLHLLASGLHEAMAASPIGPPSTWEDNVEPFGDTDGLDEVRSASILGLLRQNGCENGRASLDVPFPGEVPTDSACAFSFRRDRLSATVICSPLKERWFGFSFRANILTAS